MITPGKWEADTEGEYVFTRVPEGLMMVAQMRGWSYLTGELNLSSEEAIEVQKANARLMASAPELYEAVCDLLDYAYEALHWAGGENEIRGKAPRILREIREYQSLIDRVKGGDE